MGRKRGFDEEKIGHIVRVLANNPEGIWLRRISQETGLHPSTVTKYIEGPLAMLVEEASLGKEEKPLLRVIKLKPFALQKMEEGVGISEILRILRIMEKVGEK